MEILNFGKPQPKREYQGVKKTSREYTQRAARQRKGKFVGIMDTINSEAQNMQLHEFGSTEYRKAWDRLKVAHKAMEQLIREEM